MKRGVMMTAWLLAVLMLFAGCAADSAATAAVSPVTDICGMPIAGWVDCFTGVVVARSEVKIMKEQDQSVAEVLVEEGDAVTADQVLFVYEQGQAELQLEKAKLELEQLKYSLQDTQKKKAELEKLKKSAGKDQQLSITLEIAEADASIREAEYNMVTKEADIADLEESLEHLEVVSPVTGVVQSVNLNGGMDNYGNEKPFIVITETGNRRIKGYVNETNIASVTEGMQVVIRSRVEDKTWNGTVSMIDFESTASENGPSYYVEAAADDTQSSSKYPFYVELDNDEGLLMGQHVYIEQLFSHDENASALMLPSAYLVTDDGAPYVWAQNKAGRLEKRRVEAGAEDINLGLTEILSGLAYEDKIAFPTTDLTEGMTCVEGGYSEVEGGYEGSYEEYPEENFTDEEMPEAFPEEEIEFEIPQEAPLAVDDGGVQ